MHFRSLTLQPRHFLCSLACLSLTLTGIHAVADAAPDFGPNVTIFDPSMDQKDIEGQCNSIFETQEKNEFGSERNAIFFKPGAYTAKVKVGFYTQVYGLGKMPDDTTITGAVSVDGEWDNGNCTQIGRAHV